MTYELAKQLKDAGYKGYLHFEGDGTVTHDLSELIEACGEKFDTLTKGSWRGEGDWLAYNSFWDNEHYCPRPKEPVGVGSTPEEAVAKLWLELNNEE